jgi:hypothetical protein
MGQRRLFEPPEGTDPTEVWEELPTTTQTQVTLQLARLLLRLWREEATGDGNPEGEGQDAAR